MTDVLSQHAEGVLIAQKTNLEIIAAAQKEIAERIARGDMAWPNPVVPHIVRAVVKAATSPGLGSPRF